MSAKSLNKRVTLLAVAVAITCVALIAMLGRTRSTRADEVDCSGDWSNSTDSTVVEACAKQKIDNSLTEEQILATVTAQPYVQTNPGYTPVPMLPEPTDLKEVKNVLVDPDTDSEPGPGPNSWLGATSVWRDGAVPYTDYRMWDELYVISRPGNGITYTQSFQAGGGVYTTTTNPTLETQIAGSVGGDPDESKYEKVWTCPRSVSKLIITNITNPAYTNTNPAVSYPGLQSVVYFTTPSGLTGSFSMATEEWSFDSLEVPPDGP